MFTFPSNARVPGFRVGLPEDPPGFDVNQDGSARGSFADSSAPGFGYDPYGYGNVPQITAPTAFRRVGLFYNADSGLAPTPYRAYVPVFGDSPSQDPLRQAVDRAPNPDTDPSHPTTTSLSASQIGALIGGFIGGP